MFLKLTFHAHLILTSTEFLILQLARFSVELKKREGGGASGSRTNLLYSHSNGSKRYTDNFERREEKIDHVQQLSSTESRFCEYRFWLF